MSYQIIGQDPDLIAGWDMQQEIAGKLFDAGPGGYEADLIGSPQQGRDRFGSFLSFDGVQDALDITGVTLPDTSPSTFMFLVSSADTRSLRYLFDTLTGRLVLALVSLTSGQIGHYSNVWQDMGLSPNDGKLHMIVFTFDGVNLSNIYIDYSTHYTGAYKARAIGGSTILMAREDLVSNHTEGKLYTAAIYNKAKSAAWVKQEWERFLAFQG